MRIPFHFIFFSARRTREPSVSGRPTRAGAAMMALEGHAVGYAWAFLASLANATQDNLRKYASGTSETPDRDRGAE
jgi:hypothetical protein